VLKWTFTKIHKLIQIWIFLSKIKKRIKNNDPLIKESENYANNLLQKLQKGGYIERWITYRGLLKTLQKNKSNCFATIVFLLRKLGDADEFTCWAISKSIAYINWDDRLPLDRFDWNISITEVDTILDRAVKRWTANQIKKTRTQGYFNWTIMGPSRMLGKKKYKRSNPLWRSLENLSPPDVIQKIRTTGNKGVEELIQKQETISIPALVWAIYYFHSVDTYKGKEIMETLLNCGHKDLMDEAMHFAFENGYKIIRLPSHKEKITWT